MKRIAILLTALALVATGCNKGQKFTLTGNLETAGFSVGTDSVLVQSDAFPQLFNIPVQDGQFSYSGKVEKPAAATLKGVGGAMVTQMVVLEKGDIVFQDGLPTGTPLNDASSAFISSLRAFVKEHSSDREAVYQEAEKRLGDYLKEHGNDPSAVLVLMVTRRFVRPEALAELLQKTSPEVQNDSHVHRIKNQLKNQLK